MRSWRHPSREALQAWLEGTADTGVTEVTEVTEVGVDRKVDEHLKTCNRCATLLDELATPPEADLAGALALVYRPPDDLSARLVQRVNDRLDSMILLDVVTDLFGAGLETSKLLFTEETPDA